MKPAGYATGTSMGPHDCRPAPVVPTVVLRGHRLRSGARFCWVAALTFWILLLTPPRAGAWQATQHIHTGNAAIQEILNGQNQVTIQGKAYAVQSKVAEAIRNHPQYYRAGCVGPDGFPDIVFGQTIIHPDNKKGGGTYSSEWLEHICSSGWAYHWDHSGDAQGQQALAFAYGCLTHAAGDLWGHTLINSFAGGAWPEDVVAGRSIIARHVIVEAYIAKRTPATEVSIGVPEDFIYETFIRDRSAILMAKSSSIAFGIPYFTRLRERLVAEKAGIDCDCDWDWGEPPPDPRDAVNCAKRKYLAAWIKDIDAGLAAWPERMGEVSKALLVEGDFDRGKARLEQFALDHLLSMYGAPDKVGSFLDFWMDLPDWVKYLLGVEVPTVPDIMKLMFEQQYSLTLDELGEYFTNPEWYITDPALFPSGTAGQLDALMAMEGGQYDPEAFNANNNTIALAKMILLNARTLNELLYYDFGVPPLYRETHPSTESVMLEFIRSLDGDHQWRKVPIGGGDQHSEGMPLWNHCEAREKVFRVLFKDWEGNNFPDFGDTCVARKTWYVDDSSSLMFDGESPWTAFRTIQMGIRAANSGDTVIVAEGTYVENISFDQKSIVLTSTDPLNAAVVANTVIDGNYAGPVVSFTGVETEACLLSGFTIRKGSATEGGGIRGAHTRATIRNNVIIGNKAYNALFEFASGGGLWACNGTIENNTISGNSSAWTGGGLDACHGVIQNNAITGNSVSFLNGGGLFDCDGQIQNNTISGNSASSYGGGLCACDGQIQNNTITANSAVEGGGGLSGCNGAIGNCIIWGNTAPSGAQLIETSVPTYSCIQDWSGGGAGNISGNPQFLDVDGADNSPATYLDNNYRLASGSPCLNAGVNQDWMLTAKDFDGNPRVSGGTVDMGAYERPRQGVATWYVNGSMAAPGDGTSWAKALKTIQEGIDVSANGDTVVVSAGTYVENVRFKGKNIVLRSTDPLDATVVASTIIDGNKAGSVVTFSGTETEACVLSGFTIRNGTFSGYGGGIAGCDTRATIQNNTITGNSAGGGGGLGSCLGTIWSNTIRENSAVYHGGGLAYCPGTIRNNTITANTAIEGGGVARCNGAIVNNGISNNVASAYGGGLSFCGGTIEGNKIMANSGKEWGGGLYECDGLIQNNSISENSAIGGAGLANCDGTIQNNVINGNSATWGGGGGLAYCGGTVQNNRITSNSGGDWGGGLHECDGVIRNNSIGGNRATGGAGLAQCGGTIERNTIAGNTATYRGAGLAYCDGTIQNNRIVGNSGPEWGGGLFQCNGPIRNNTITANSAVGGAGLSDCTGRIENNTIADNSATYRGGGVASCDDIRNCIIWGNTAPSEAQVWSTRIPAYSCIQDWTGGGEGNISAGPGFVDPDGADNTPSTYMDNNWRVASGSPCIDAGKNESWMTGAVDLDGRPRLINVLVDMGAYESGCEGGPTWYVNGSVAVSGDGRTWESAFKTIQEGIDRSCSGDTVIVAQGAYIEQVQLFGKNIVLTSTDPLDAWVVAGTILDGSQSRSVVSFSGTETEACVLSGFTIRNGSASGINGNGALATIQNNVITGNSGWAGGGLLNCYGVIQNNIVAGNIAGFSGGGLCWCHGRIRNNLIAGNSVLSRFSGEYPTGGGLSDCDGEIANNTITGNSVLSYSLEPATGGGLSGYNGTIKNCIIWGNIAQGPQVYASSAPAYSCIQDWSGGGEWNIALNPGFVDGDGRDNDPKTFADNSCRLSAGSPCIDAGFNEGWMAGAVDLDGHARVQDGTVDIGAYEALGMSPAISLSCTSLSAAISRGENAPSQSFEVWNSGAGTLSYRVIVDATWLSCTPTTGTSAGEHDGITVNYSTSGLSAGRHLATISIADANAWNSPQTVLVELVTTERPDIETGLVGHWKLEETSGTIAHDSSGNNHPGTLRGNPQWTEGGIGVGLDFDGTDDHVALPIGSLIGSLRNSSFAAWVNFSDTGQYWQRVFDFGSGTTRNMFLTPRSDANVMRFAITTGGGGAAEQRADAMAPLPGGWHHVAVTIDADNDRITLYLDGAVAGQNTGATLTPSDLGNTTQNWLGRSQYADPYFDGALADVRIYSRTLKDRDVGVLWDSGRSSRISVLLVEPGGGFRLTWNSRPGGEYVIWSCSDLDSGAWTQEQTVVATGDFASWTDSSPAGSRKFYRLEQR